MRLFSQAKNIILEFLFPKSLRTLELEGLNPSDLLKRLPLARELEEKLTCAIFDYKHNLTKDLVWELKYKGNALVADVLGTILYDTLCQELEELSLFDSAKWEERHPLLVPIPISEERRIERGWNQSELLVESILRHDQRKIFKYLKDQLVKLRHTESQTKTTSKQERKTNLLHSMGVVDGTSVDGKVVVVIDDVTTTGSTFKEARRALKEAGAKKIFCLAVAH